MGLHENNQTVELLSAIIVLRIDLLYPFANKLFIYTMQT